MLSRSPETQVRSDRSRERVNDRKPRAIGHEVAVRQSSEFQQLLIASLLAILDHHWRRQVQAEAQAGAGTGRQPPDSSRLHLATPADDERCSKRVVAHSDIVDEAVR